MLGTLLDAGITGGNDRDCASTPSSGYSTARATQHESPFGGKEHSTSPSCAMLLSLEASEVDDFLVARPAPKRFRSGSGLAVSFT